MGAPPPGGRLRGGLLLLPAWPAWRLRLPGGACAAGAPISSRRNGGKEGAGEGFRFPSPAPLLETTKKGVPTPFLDFPPSRPTDPLPAEGPYFVTAPPLRPTSGALREAEAPIGRLHRRHIWSAGNVPCTETGPRFLSAHGQKKRAAVFKLKTAAPGGCISLFQLAASSPINGKLSMDIHSCHIRLIIPLNHTEKFPAVSFIKARMICNQIDRSNSFRFHISYNDI